MKDVLALDVVEQAHLVRSGQVSGNEIISAAQAAIDATDGDLNAVVHRFSDVGWQPDRPFSGVPMLLKDSLAACAGRPRTEGSVWLKRIGWRDRHDSVVVARLKAAGFAILGRTNTPEQAMLDTTEPTAFGPTHNPWSAERTPGGSSGGSAAAVAAGYVSVAHGTDASGSLRAPASWCGLVTLKPSRGRVPLGPDHSEVGALGFRYTHGVFTRSVVDAAAMLDVMAGPVEGDVVPLPLPKHSFASALDREPPVLRVGLITEPPDSSFAVDPEVADGLAATAAVLEAAGHRLVPVRPPEIELPSDRELGTASAAAITSLIDWWCRRSGTAPQPDDLEPFTWELVEEGRTASAISVQQHLEWLQASARAMAGWVEEVDVLLSPTTAMTAPLLGRYDEACAEERGAEISRTMCFTFPFNITGQPAMSLPVGLTEAGLPFGVQIVGAHGAEATLLALARQVEISMPWKSRRPRLSSPTEASSSSAVTR